MPTLGDSMSAAVMLATSVAWFKKKAAPLPPLPPPLPSIDMPSVYAATVLVLIVGLICLRGPGLKTIYERLFTKEDNFNFHKTLGIYCLLSFLYRFANVGPSDMRFSASGATLLTIAVHASLSLSSLIFHIPLKRIASGYRIWPEYRLHSIIFACRSLLGMLVTWYELKHGLEPNSHLNIAIVLGTLLAADVGSAAVGEAGHSNTIRDLDANAPTRFFFSAMQFHATMGCLFGLRRFSTQFLYVWIIQLNAFLMTIRRKNLAPHSVLVTTYGLMLTFGFVLASYEHHRVGAFLMINTLGNLAGVLRIGASVPKYPLWVGMAVLTHLARPTLDTAHPLAPYWLYAYGASVGALLVVGARKVARDNRREAKAAAEEAAAELVAAKLAAANAGIDVKPTPSCSASVGGGSTSSVSPAKVKAS